MRIGVSLAAVIFVSLNLVGQQPKPWSVDHLCGRLEHLQRIPSRKKPDRFSEKRTSLAGVRLELFERQEGTLCCIAAESRSATVSQKRGYFEFKHELAGNYWLRAKWNSRDYELPVVLSGQKKSPTSCAQQGVQLEDDGRANWWLMVTVD